VVSRGGVIGDLLLAAEGVASVVVQVVRITQEVSQTGSV
jgi:hypothetical protein